MLELAWRSEDLPGFRKRKGPSFLNLNGVNDGLLNMGISKKSSGTYSDCAPKEKFCRFEKN
ncbi:hypothetical protein [Brenneria rubrifaciens]|uniref:hypothetical protein n=1 Tax=Brenneria rubrifaciens TaxID=55213 RepID=UPI0015863551|nr:hypothetical protein [Brenneria rubrifaciens]